MYFFLTHLINNRCGFFINSFVNYRIVIIVIYVLRIAIIPFSSSTFLFLIFVV